jgi:hypothetical protein
MAQKIGKITAIPGQQRAGQLEGIGAPVNTTLPVANPYVPAPAAAAPAPVVAPALTGNRDQWSAPANVTARGDTSRLEGYDPAKLAGGENTLKYQAGNIFSGFDPSGGVQQLFADEEFKRLFPNAQAVGDDKIDWGYGDAPVDVIRGYGAPGSAWAWQPQDEGGVTPSAGMPQGQAGLPNSSIADILAEINAIAGESQSPMERQALLEMLMQQQPEAGVVI